MDREAQMEANSKAVKQAWNRITEQERDALAVSADFLVLAVADYHSVPDGDHLDAQALATMSLAASAQKQAHVATVAAQAQDAANLLAFAGLSDLGIPVALRQQAAQRAADALGLSEPAEPAGEEAGSHDLLS